MLGDFWLMDPAGKIATILHEMLHVWGLNDKEVFDSFRDYGLKDMYGEGSTESISDWIRNKCENSNKPGP